ncbi:cytochrome c family protein, partial [Pseudomonas stutzeri]|nr:cytochrome c family protein [Stutzerimonas stutzeri]
MKPRVIVGASCLVAGALAGGAARAAAAGAPAAGYTGDAVRGQSVYERCLACHAIAYDRTGPRHCGLFGRRAGSVPGFGYSEAMEHSG